MKKLTSFAALIVAALVSSASAETALPAASPEASPGPRCKVNSRSPEVYTIYGDKKDMIVQKLANIPAKLSERRVFLQVTQGDASAKVTLYEQQNDETFTVTEWTPKQTSKLVADIDREIVANKGEYCVGEQVKAVLRQKLGKGKITNGVAVPDSPQAAFAPSVEQASGEYIKSTLIILC
jgi:hypothetical protein